MSTDQEKLRRLSGRTYNVTGYIRAKINAPMRSTNARWFYPAVRRRATGRVWGVFS